jgi:hypothetical protein
MIRLQHNILILLILGLFGCNQSDLTLDPLYPAKVNELTNEQVNVILDQLEQTSFANCVSIDQFGFPLLNQKDERCKINDSLKAGHDYETIVTRVQQGFYEAAYFLNLTDPASVQIESIKTLQNITFEQFTAQYPDSSPPAWVVSSKIQMVDGIEVRGSRLQLLLSHDKLIGISGHWYTNIYVPANDQFDEAGAKQLLLNRTLKQSRNEITITEQTTWNDSKKVIVPVRKSLAIELRVCWALYPTGWEIVVDSHTGEIITTVKIN